MQIGQTLVPDRPVLDSSRRFSSGNGINDWKSGEWKGNCRLIRGNVLAYCLLFSAMLSASTISYKHDTLDRLTQINYPDGTIITYSYDPAGNRTQRVVSNAPAIGYEIYLSKNVGTGGTVSCESTFLSQGGSTTCTAIPNEGYGFDGWTGDCNGATCVLNDVNGPKIVNAMFSIGDQAILVSVNILEGGAATCTPNPVPSGQSATCTAFPAEDYQFVGWTGDCGGANCTLNNVTTTKSVTANFSLVEFCERLGGANPACTFGSWRLLLGN